MVVAAGINENVGMVWHTRACACAVLNRKLLLGYWYYVIKGPGRAELRAQFSKMSFDRVLLSLSSSHYVRPAGSFYTGQKLSSPRTGGKKSKRAILHVCLCHKVEQCKQNVLGVQCLIEEYS